MKTISKTYKQSDRFMEKKYKTEQEGKWLRIIALKDFSDVKKGDRGGLIDNEENLSHEGGCWVYDNAQVFGFARVSGNARVCGEAKIFGECWVCGDAEVYGNAKVYGNARIYGWAKVYDNARICATAWVYGRAKVYDNARISGNSEVYGDAQVYDNARIKGGARITAEICGNVKLLSTEEVYHITTSIKNNEDYIRLFINRKSRITPLPSNSKNVIIDYDISISGQNYIQNIKTIRQLYGETQISENAR